MRTRCAGQALVVWAGCLCFSVARASAPPPGRAPERLRVGSLLERQIREGLAEPWLGEAVADAGAAQAQPSQLQSIEELSMEEFDWLCPATRLPFTLPGGTAVDLEIPRLVTMTDRIELLRAPDGSEMTLELPAPGGARRHRLFAAEAIACAGRTYRPVLLSPTEPGYGSRPGEAFETFNRAHVSHLCLRTRQPAGPAWSCLEGLLADGVSGYAVRDEAPRPFWVRALTWGPNTYRMQFHLLPGLGDLVLPVPEAERNGFAADTAWGLVLAQPHPPGFPRRSRWRDWLAMLALKTTTNFNGHRVSPYNTPDRGAGATPDRALLNPCEPGYTAAHTPDLASSGRLVDGVLIDLQVGEWYARPTSGCRWSRTWKLPRAPAASRRGCTRFEIDPRGEGAAPVAGINLSDTGPRRCPTWTGCPWGQPCCLWGVLPGRPGLALHKADGTVWRWDPAGGGPPSPVVDSEGRALDRVLQLSGGDGVRCARKVDGTAWCWGAGDGGPPGREAAVQVRLADGRPLAGVQKVAPGRGRVCAALVDGALLCWDEGGATAAGGARRSAPRPVLGPDGPLGGVDDVACGEKHCCARREDGTVWCWGGGPAGEKGAGPAARSSPRALPVAALRDIAHIAAGGRLACALGLDGRARCWGAGGPRRSPPGPAAPPGELLRDGAGAVADAREVGVFGGLACLLRGPGRALWCARCAAAGRAGGCAPATPVLDEDGGTVRGALGFEAVGGGSPGALCVRLPGGLPACARLPQAAGGSGPVVVRRLPPPFGCAPAPREPGT